MEKSYVVDSQVPPQNQIAICNCWHMRQIEDCGRTTNDFIPLCIFLVMAKQQRAAEVILHAFVQCQVKEYKIYIL